MNLRHTHTHTHTHIIHRERGRRRKGRGESREVRAERRERPSFAIRSVAVSGGGGAENVCMNERKREQRGRGGREGKGREQGITVDNGFSGCLALVSIR